MAKLAIKGNIDRGEEVIALLEILGGSNAYRYIGNNPCTVYYIDEKYKNYIICSDAKKVCDCIIFNLEEFLEKFPYKIGDKVSSKYLKNYKIEKMEWEDTNNRVIYKLQGMGWYSADELQPYKKETMEHFKNNEETKMSIPESMKQIAEAAENLIAPDYVQDGFIMSEEQLKKQERCIIFQNDAPDKTELVLGDEFEIKVDGGKTFVVRKQPQYPKTYEECREIMGIKSWNTLWGEDSTLYEEQTEDLINAFIRLKVCRDSYWKIAGDWKPNFVNEDDKFIIDCYYGKIYTTSATNYNRVLVFPTEEMRDAFYENFKELIESCKELL